MMVRDKPQRDKLPKEKSTRPPKVSKDVVPVVSDEFRTAAEQQIAEFVNNDESSLEFPSSLTNTQRKYIHTYAQRINLKSRSSGKGDERSLTLYKHPKESNSNPTAAASNAELKYIWISDASQFVIRYAIDNVKFDAPPLLPTSMRLSRNNGWGMLSQELSDKYIPPQPRRISPQMHEDKINLPIFQFRDAFLSAVESNSVIILNGETGSGKTTQVPQYLLEHHSATNTPCRVICTQPRRVAAISVAQRVAAERGEHIGGTVGYQIRHEGKLSKKTNLIYTTSGVIIRSLMNDAKKMFNRITHLIIDEIHERDRNTDFILISLKKNFENLGNLKVILMSATMNITHLRNYFNDCPVINVPGRSFDVKKFYLEDILFHTNYTTKSMNAALDHIARQKAKLEKAEADKYLTDTNAIDKHTQEIVDECIRGCFDDPIEAENFLVQLSYLVFEEEMLVDACETGTGRTILMAAAKCNNLDFITKLRGAGAKTDIKDSVGCTAKDYAHPDYDYYFEEVMDFTPVPPSADIVDKGTLLDAYETTRKSDEEVDQDLLLTMIKKLCETEHPGAILVFLPGYTDIIHQRDLITDTLDYNTYRLFVLHGHMNTSDQQEALKPCDKRKIILSTNIAETSITIPELAFVIDTGKVKMKTYDALTGSSQLRSVWISKAGANQRAGRSGRTQNGVCYRMYSEETFESMSKFCISEFLRVPLEEICLFAKTLDGNSSVAEYLSHALDPPSSVSVNNAIKKLKILNVFDENENVTDLGRHLVNIPLDVQLGKMLLYSIMLQCVDPILTIVAFHSVKDPFTLPMDRADKTKALKLRKAFSEDAYSDQLGILKMVSEYCSYSNDHWGRRRFCEENFISSNTMDMLLATRSQISQQIQNMYNLRPNINNNSISFIKICLAAGLYPNLVMVDYEKERLSTQVEKKISVHTQSALRYGKGIFLAKEAFGHDWIAFVEKSQNFEMNAINHNTPIPSFIIALFCGSITAIIDDEDENEDEPEILEIDDWIKFKATSDMKPLLTKLRVTMREWFSYFLRDGYTKRSDQYGSVLIPVIESLMQNELGGLSDKLEFSFNKRNGMVSGRQQWRRDKTRRK